MTNDNVKNLIFIDCEASGKCPSTGKLTEFGAVAYPSRATFHGVVIEGQWINDSFWRTLGRNPFGYSARRIGDFYSGLIGDFMDSSSWKHLRITKHDHNPVHDAMGNLEAFDRLLKGERPKSR
jgi:hypothetical protein